MRPKNQDAEDFLDPRDISLENGECCGESWNSGTDTTIRIGKED